MCVCDRCGQPFAYTVPEDYEGDDNVSSAGIADARDAGHSSASSSSRNVGNVPDASYTARPIPDEKPSTGHNSFKPTIRPEASYSPAGYRHGGRGCLRTGLIITFVLFLLAFLAFQQCHTERSYYGTDMESAYDESDDF